MLLFFKLPFFFFSQLPYILFLYLPIYILIFSLGILSCPWSYSSYYRRSKRQMKKNYFFAQHESSRMDLSLVKYITWISHYTGWLQLFTWQLFPRELWHFPNQLCYTTHNCIKRRYYSGLKCKHMRHFNLMFFLTVLKNTIREGLSSHHRITIFHWNLDHEIWLCLTHLDDVLDKFRPY